jgi:hypothetical protein
MPGSFDLDEVLQNVRPKQIYRLLEIVQTATIRDTAYVTARFQEEGQHFRETRRFLEDIGWLRSDGTSVFPASAVIPRLLATSGDSRHLMFATALVNDLGRYTARFADYLSQFSVQDGLLVHRPIGERRFQESAPRDFLMELGAVRHRLDSDSYILAEPFTFLMLWGRNAHGTANPHFERLAQDRIRLGKAAELAALEWERRRVGPEWSDRVVHVSGRYPAACFDIQSVTLAGAQTEPRFIEVKAVAADSLEFHWSHSEVEAAHLLADRYFLYLVPIQPAGVPDVTAIQLIQNPYSAVYDNSQTWYKAEADIVCRKRKDLVS